MLHVLLMVEILVSKNTEIFLLFLVKITPSVFKSKRSAHDSSCSSNTYSKCM